MAVAGSPRVIVCGGGIIGVSTAYYLTKRGCTPLIVERKEVAAAASGKAGGFLAKDWNDGSPVGDLTRTSFDLHEELSRELGAERIDYRRLSCRAVAVEDGGGAAPKSRKLEHVEWADLGAYGSRAMGDERTIAQVHPRKLTHALLDEATKAGASLRIGVVESVESTDAGARARVDGSWLDADAVVLAMGPWTSQVSGVPGVPTVYGQKYHSVLLQAPRALSQAVFFQGLGDPEVYPRPDGEVYVTGFPDAPVVVGELPGEVKVEQKVLDRLTSVAHQVSSELREASVTAGQSCHLPIAGHGLPVIGELAGAKRVFVATGHGCWGILNAPATGKALSELIVDGKASTVSLDAFKPRA